MAKKGQAQEKKPQVPSKLRRRVKHAPSKEEKLRAAVDKFSRKVSQKWGDRKQKEHQIKSAVKSGQLDPLPGPEFQAALASSRISPPVAAVRSLLR